VHKLLIGVGAAIILGAVNFSIYQREQLLESGRPVLLELAPVDPRSLMQGDYMALRFAVESSLFGVRENLKDGRIVLTLDERGVGTFTRFDSGAPLATNEVVMRYRVRNERAKFGTNAYFFQEGTADLYAGARFGEFRVAASGDAILTRLRGEKLEVLGPPR
jgi:uncharacterized membrane-anchored protein